MTSSMRRILCISLLWLVAVTLTFGQNQTPTKPAQLSASAAIELIRPAVAQVMAQDGERWSAGSGFVVADNYVITNCHVVGLCRVNPLFTNPSVTVGFPIPNSPAIPQAHFKESFQLMHAEIVDTDLVNDLTLLKLLGVGRPIVAATGAGPPAMILLPSGSARLSDAALNDGTDIFVSGFPFQEPSLITQRSMIAGTVERRDIPSLGEPENHSDVILLDVLVNHGNSGGPVYLAQTGEVIGVAEAFVGTLNNAVPVPPPIPPLTPQPPPQLYVVVENSGLGVAIPAKYVIALLVKNHLVATAPTKR